MRLVEGSERNSSSVQVERILKFFIDGDGAQNQRQFRLISKQLVFMNACSRR
jgi:hypothetical protein